MEGRILLNVECPDETTFLVTLMVRAQTPGDSARAINCGQSSLCDC
jgi:hypothetical protein